MFRGHAREDNRNEKMKILAQLMKNAIQILNLLREGYGVNALLTDRMSEWQKFSEGRGDTKGDNRYGHPVTTKTNENVKMTRNPVRKDRRLNIRMTGWIWNRNGAKNVNVRFEYETCAEMIKIERQKSARHHVNPEILEITEASADFLKTVVSFNETPFIHFKLLAPCISTNIYCLLRLNHQTAHIKCTAA